MPALYELKAERKNLHGHFSRDLPPALTIQPGDTVRFQCLDAGWGLENYNGVDGDRRLFAPWDPAVDNGHALTGPVYVRGAKPGMTLSARIDALQVGEWGWAQVGGWKSGWNERLGVAEAAGVYHTWTLNHAARTARSQHGHTVALRPFLGLCGLPPAEPGMHSTTPPRATGGNLDCKELTAGSTLYLPVAVEGGLFSTGDGHAAQGDGEICGTAIECPIERADITFGLLDDFPIAAPVIETPDAWITLGFHEDLDEAVVAALESMLSLLKRLHGLARPDALALASVAVDFRVTQMVNDVKGAHAVLKHGAIR